MTQPNLPDNAALQQRKKLYRSSKWRRLRRQLLQQEPFCVACQKAGRYTVATVIDHVHGHGLDWKENFWNTDGLQSLCQSCHSMKTTQEIKHKLSRPWRG